jgi:hypothetical protein
VETPRPLDEYVHSEYVLGCVGDEREPFNSRWRESR